MLDIIIKQAGWIVRKKLTLIRKWNLLIVTVFLVPIILNGCASAPRTLLESDVPLLGTDMGRIYLYRLKIRFTDPNVLIILTHDGTNAIVGDLDGEEFFAVDLIPGDYTITGALQFTSIENAKMVPLSFSIQPNEIKYILTTFDVSNKAISWEDKTSNMSRSEILRFSYNGDVPVSDFRMETVSKKYTSIQILSEDEKQKQDANKRPKSGFDQFLGALRDASANNEYTREYTRKQAEEEHAKTFDPEAEPVLASSVPTPPDYGLLKRLIAQNIIIDPPLQWINVLYKDNISLEGVQLLRIGMFKGEYWPIEARIRGKAVVIGASNVSALRTSDEERTFDKIAQFQVRQNDFSDWDIKRVAVQQ